MHRSIGESLIESRPRHNYSRILQNKNKRTAVVVAGTVVPSPVTTDRAPEPKLHSARLSPANVTLLDLVPENPCSTRADRSLRLEAFIIRLVGLTLSPHLLIRNHKFIQSHDLNRRTAAWKLLDYSIVDSNQVGQARITYASEPRAIH